MSVVVNEDKLSDAELADIYKISKEGRFMEIYRKEKIRHNHQAAIARARSAWFRFEF